MICVHFLWKRHLEGKIGLLEKNKTKTKKTYKQRGHAHKKDIIEEHQFIDNNEKMPYYFLPIILNIIIKKQTYFHITCETAK